MGRPLVFACSLLAFAALFCAVSAAQAQAIEGYQISEPVHFLSPDVVVTGARIYGLPQNLLDYLIQSGLIDCGCLLKKAKNCSFSLLKLKPVEANVALPPRTVKIVIPSTEEFIQVYDALYQESDPAGYIERGVQRGREARGEQESVPEEESKIAGGADEEAESRCKPEAKICLSLKSASIVFGCAGMGEIEISTDGEVSLSMATGSKKLH